MQLREYWSVLWRRKWMILAIIAVTIGFLWRSGGLAPPRARYQATATILAVSQPGRTLPYPIEAIRSKTMAQQALEVAAVEGDPLVVLDDVRVRPRKDTSVVDIEVERSDPKEAADLANGFANAYLTRLGALTTPDPETLKLLRAAHERLRDEAASTSRSETDQVRRDLELNWISELDRLLARSYSEVWLRQLLVSQDPDSQGLSITSGETSALGLRVGAEIGLLEPATPPRQPVESPMAQQARVAGGLLGVALIAALTFAFALEHIDDKLRTAADVERATGLRLLVSLPSRRRIRRAIKKFIAAGVKIGGYNGAVGPGLSPIPDPRLAEAFQSLRVQIDLAARERPGGAILIASPGNGGAKTAVAALLGTVFAQAGRRVVLVSADLHRPGLETIFRPEDARGLGEAASTAGDPASFVQRTWVPNLVMVPAGSAAMHPADVLASEATARIIELAKNSADVVLVEAAPVLDGEEAAILVPHCRTVLMVLESGETRNDEASAAKALLEKVQNGAEFLGAVLTGVEDGRQGHLHINGHRKHRPVRGFAR